MGALRDFKQFFLTIDLGALVIDPAGINDRLERWLVGFNSHDGSSPLMFANTMTRVVCDNTLRLALRNAKSTVKVRHTAGALQFDMEEARRELDMWVEWAKSFTGMAEQMLASPVGGREIDRVLDGLFPIDDDATDRQRRYHAERITAIRSLYVSEKNSRGVGS